MEVAPAGSLGDLPERFLVDLDLSPAQNGSSTGRLHGYGREPGGPRADRVHLDPMLGGEMVPHVKIESELQDVAPDVSLAVSAIADDRKGERLVVLHTPLPEGLSVDVFLTALRERKLPNLFIPRADSFIEVDEVPMLPSGKLDLRAIGEIARERLSNPRRSTP